MRRISQNNHFVLMGALFTTFVVILFFTPSRLSTDVLQSGNSTSITLPTTLKVVLVQFKDVRYDSFFTNNQKKRYTFIHKMSDFQALLASLGTYNNRNSDDDPVFGSFRDYFYANSRQRYSPTVQILNQTDANGYPIWIQLSGNKSSYNSTSFMTAANAAATAAGLDISTSTTVRRCYIYTGNFVNAINVFANSVNGHTMVVPERLIGRQGNEDENHKLVHMGWFCHEFGHLMGANHTTTKQWDLMDTGHKNAAGNVAEANRPASMNPWFLYKSGWANLNYINSDLNNVSLSYNTSSTALSTYYIRAIPGTSENFLVENRQYSNTYDKSLPGAVVGASGGILIWNILGQGLNLLATDLIEADNQNVEDPVNMSNDVFRPSVYITGKINDITTPTDLNLRNGSFSSFAISNYFSTGNPLTVNFQINFVAPPTNLVITNSGQNGQHPILQWTASPDPDLASYKVYRGYQDSKLDPIIWLTNPVATVTTTTWTDGLVTIDTGAPSSVHYRLKAVDSANNYSDYSNSVSTKSFTVPKESTEPTEPTNLSAPKEFVLHQNYPNAFNPSTEICYELPNAGHVNLVIFNITGQTIRTLVDEPRLAGYHSILWDGHDQAGNEVASGIYIYRFSARSNEAGSQAFETVKKMTLLR